MKYYLKDCNMVGLPQKPTLKTIFNRTNKVTGPRDPKGNPHCLKILLNNKRIVNIKIIKLIFFFFERN